MICGNISNFFFFFFGLVFFLFFFFFFNLPPFLYFGPLRILFLKEIEAIELMLTLSRFTKAFHSLKTKPKKPKLPLLPPACQKRVAESPGMSTAVPWDLHTRHAEGTCAKRPACRPSLQV